MRFDELKLSERLMKNLQKVGFKEMTPIQEATFPIISSGKDLCGLAETGSGKTAACAIPLIEKIDPSVNQVQGLVLVPTRELCLQYVEEIQLLSRGTGIKPFGIYGGFSKDIQVAKLKHEVHILVATPGRLIDLIYDRLIDLSNVECAILDEADELLKVGFLEDIEFILSCIIHEHQTLLFSATMAEEIKKLAHDYLKEPVHISLISDRSTPESIEHYFNFLHFKEKEKKIKNFLNEERISQAIIFCNSRAYVDKVYEVLKTEFSNIDFIHAGLSQERRSSIFQKFRKKKITYLIATDVAGRGLDFTHVSHVINWDFPNDTESYTHRTGRAGRMGRKGVALSFITKRDISCLQKIIKEKKITPLWMGKNPLEKDHKSTHPNKKKDGGKYKRYNQKKKSFTPKKK